jgi:hypothetical protein
MIPIRPMKRATRDIRQTVMINFAAISSCVSNPARMSCLAKKNENTDQKQSIYINQV